MSVADLFKEEAGGSQGGQGEDEPKQAGYQASKGVREVEAGRVQLVLKQVEGLAGQK